MYFIDPKVISTQREFSTPSNPIISTSRPRDSASVFSKKKKASISIPFGISLETLDIFEPIDREVSLYSDTLILQDRENKELNIFNKNLQAIRSVGANVLALWSKDEIGDSGWKSGKKITLPNPFYISRACNCNTYIIWWAKLNSILFRRHL